MKELPTAQFMNTLTPRRVLNAGKVVVAYVLSRTLKKPYVWGLPFVITIEPTNRCNLRCPQCSTGSENSKRAKGTIDCHVYQKLLQTIGPYVFQVLLFDQGEPFLHEQLIELIKLAKRYRLCVTTSTNGHFLQTEEIADQLIASRLDTLIVSVDGASQGTYVRYRRGGNLNQVIEGVKTLSRRRKTLNSDLPKIYIQCVVMKHNEHEIPSIEQLSRDAGADRLLLKSAYIDDTEAAKVLLPDNPAYRRYYVSKDTLLRTGRRVHGCRRLWFSTVVHWNGAIVPCCFDRDDQFCFGNLNQTDFINIWRSKTYQSFRQKILDTQNGKINICGNCTEGLKVYI